MIEEAIEQGLTNCPRCNVWLNYEHGKQPNSPQIDHIKPHAEGGTNDRTNLRILCAACNAHLGGKTGRQRLTQKQRQRRANPIDAQPTANW